MVTIEIHDELAGSWGLSAQRPVELVAAGPGSHTS